MVTVLLMSLAGDSNNWHFPPYFVPANVRQRPTSGLTVVTSKVRNSSSRVEPITYLTVCGTCGGKQLRFIFQGEGLKVAGNSIRHVLSSQVRCVAYEGE